MKPINGSKHPRKPTLRELLAREAAANAQIQHAAVAITLLYAAALSQPDGRFVVPVDAIRNVSEHPDRYTLTVDESGAATVVQVTLKEPPVVLFAPNGARMQ